MDVTFQMGALAGYAVEGILVILIPLVLLIAWKLKTRASLVPALVGMIIFPVFGILLKLIPGYFLLLADNPVSRAITGNIWLYSIIGGGLLAGVFEEGGRYVAFKLILKKYKTNRDAVSYGIGHGGFESAYVGLFALSYIAMGIMVNSGNMDMLLMGLNEADAAAVLAQIEGLAATPFYMPAVLGVLERISAMTLHTALSVFVFAAAREKKCILLFPAAILLHTLMNSLTGLYNAGMVSVLALECIFAVYAAVMACLAFVLYKKLGTSD